MTVRLYISKVIGDGSPLFPYQAKVPGTMLIRSYPEGHPDYGKPVFDWTLVIADLSLLPDPNRPLVPDFSLVDADSDNERVFGIDLPDNITTKAQLRTYLQSRTVGEIPAARRTALQTRLTNRGVDLSGITLQSTWFDVFRRIRNRLDDSLAGNDG